MPQHNDRAIKVFVSATTSDLGKEREEVADALSKAGIFPVVQGKTLPTLKGDVTKALYRLLEGCSGAICLVGAQFGSYPTDAGHPLRSYTQMEYDFIATLGIPVLRFLTPDVTLEQSTDPPVLKELQRKHRDSIKNSNQGWCFFSSIPNLRERVILDASSMKGSIESFYAIPGFRVEGRMGADGSEELWSAVYAPGESGEARVSLRLLGENVGHEVRTWFVERGRSWRRLKHANVVAALGASDLGLLSARPYVATEDLDGWEDILAVLKRVKRLSDEASVGVMRKVTEAFECAAKDGLKILSISLADLYCRGKDIKVGGLHSCCRRDLHPFKDRCGWSKVTAEWAHMAPELDEPAPRTPEAADVFALGVLLERLCGRSAAAATRLEGELRRDPLRCIAFHCLAADPAVRFRTVRQVRLFLDERVSHPSLEPPWVEVGAPCGDSCAGLRVSKYPITNAEYERFCADSGHPRPRHLIQEDGRAERLRGPWLPVVNVSLSDARSYCAWLSRSSGRVWRIPTVADWHCAALHGRPSQRDCAPPRYPWGDEPATDMSTGELRANFLDHYHGPTVVGSFWDGGAERCLDLAGNVWEWTEDRQPETPAYVVLGGAYDYEEDSLRIAERKAVIAATRDEHIGFRIVTGGGQ